MIKTKFLARDSKEKHDTTSLTSSKKMLQ